MPFQDISKELSKLSGEYHYHEPPDVLVKLQELISQALRAIADFLRHLHIELPGMANTSAVGDTLQIILIAVGGLCTIALVFFMWTRMRQLRLQAARARRGASSLDIELDSAGWKEQARQFHDHGKHREAVRALYLSLLQLLDEKEVLNYAPTRSNYEYFYALANSVSLQQGFRQLTDRVEVIWFGDHDAGSSDYRFCSDLLARLETEVEHLVATREAQSVS
ncbi:MAG: DUF4129 domain-containing protein [Cyanobacteria bacterium]|nr:DUF4129 domain-containing protein [Cyanobacteriota bacterium]